jgi:hypothetical protein
MTCDNNDEIAHQRKQDACHHCEEEDWIAPFGHRAILPRSLSKDAPGNSDSDSGRQEDQQRRRKYDTKPPPPLRTPQ